jgi:hypothetical protein
VAIYGHETYFAGKEIRPWDSAKGIKNPETTIYRIGVDYRDKESWLEKFNRFIADPRVDQVTALVIGHWLNDIGEMDNSKRVVQALVAAKEKLPNPTAIFIGDITMEESEISWIEQTDAAPLLHAYPNLEIFRVRGGNNLSFTNLKHDKLKTLIVEAGGLDRRTVQQIVDASLPELEHLELWLGTANYGGNSTVSDLAPLFTENPFPKLRYLGLMNSDISNEIAVAIAQSSVMERIEVLDLSMGTLDDTGVMALLNNPALLKLSLLDIHHHYCTDKMITTLTNTLQEAGVRFNVGASQLNNRDARDWRFVEVSE